MSIINNQTEFRHFCFTSYEDELPKELLAGFSYIVFQRERCPTTGRDHWQGYAECTTKLKLCTIKRRLGDPAIHVERRKGTPEEASDYCKKDESRAESYDFFEAGTCSKSRKRKGGHNWNETALLAIQATTRQEAEEIIRTEQPGRLLSNWNNINGYLNHRFPNRGSQFCYKPECAWKLPSEITDWLKNEFTKTERAKCLIVVGPTRLGKTNWARSLGTHMFWRGNVAYGDWVQSSKYIVIDDVPWKFVPQKKSILTQMGDVTLTDKYVRKLTVMNDKPAIFLSNETPDFEDDANYWKENSVIVHITDKMYDPEQRAIS